MWKKVIVPFNEKSFSFIKAEILSQFPQQYRKDIKIKFTNVGEKLDINLYEDGNKLLLKGGIFELSIDYHNEKIMKIFKRLYLVIKYYTHFFTYFSLNENISYNRYTLIGLMSRGLAHEINNPLAIISTYIQYLNMQEKGKEKKEIYNNILSAVDRASHIVFNISKFAKTEDKKELLNINSEVKNILEFFENIRKYRFSDVSINFKPGKKNYTILMNKNDLYEIIYLILLNACEAMEKRNQPKLNISIKKSEFDIIIEITDNGTGILKKNMGKIYMPFFTTKSEKNTGLGLSIVKYLVDKNECNIDIKSAYKKGTVVRVIFGGEYEDTFGGR